MLSLEFSVLCVIEWYQVQRNVSVAAVSQKTFDEFFAVEKLTTFAKIMGHLTYGKRFKIFSKIFWEEHILFSGIDSSYFIFPHTMQDSTLKR